jgi:DNA-directed RNA polymerase subunit RPC12/RpoP
MATDIYPLARCAICGERVGIVYDPAQGTPLILCAECDEDNEPEAFRRPAA